ncbi:MAG: glycosyltransferase [Bergeyella sp.]
MRILQIINSLGTGGAEKLLLDTLPLYRQAGIEMDLLVLWDNNHPFLQKLKELNCCKIYVLKQSANYKDIYNPLHIFKIKKILKQYDIAHVHLFPAQYFSVFANQLNGSKTKLLFTEHNTSNTRIGKFWFKPIEKYIYKRYSRLVCISYEINEIYQDYLKGIVRQEVIHNGVDVGRIFNAESLDKNQFFSQYQNGDKIILQVSAFRPQKDQKTLIDALDFLGNEYKVILVGAGDTEEEIKNYVIQKKLDGRVFFLGQYMDIPRLLKSVDYVVLSSKYEGLSLASIEGLASGRPFIASDVPGLRDVVQGAGLLFEQGNAEELAQLIQQLSEDSELYQKTVEKCLARAEDYDIHVMVEKHIDLYRKLYDKKSNDF